MMGGMHKVLVLLVVVILLGVASLAVSVTGSSEETNVQIPEGTSGKKKLRGITSSTLSEAEKESFLTTVDALVTQYEGMSAKSKSLETSLKAIQEKVPAKEELKRLEAKISNNSSNMEKVLEHKIQELKSLFDNQLRSVKARTTSELPNSMGYGDYINDGMRSPDRSAEKTSDTIQDRPAGVVASVGDTYVFQPISRVVDPYSDAGDDVPFRAPGARTNMPTYGKKRKDAVDKDQTTAQQGETTNNTPVFTINADATLFNSKLMSSLVGVIPKNGEFNSPFRFKLLLGNENLASNGFYIPGLKNATLSGYALGNKTLSCVRGVIDRFTFVFEDQTIATVTANSQTESSTTLPADLLTNGIAHLSDRYGNNCIRGQYISNITEYMKDRLVSSSFAAGADALAASEEIVKHTDTSIQKFVSGDTGKYIGANVLSGGLKEIAEIAREQQRDALEFVYIPNGQEVVLNIDKQINIDYNPNGRKLFYGMPNFNNKRIHNARLD